VQKKLRLKALTYVDDCTVFPKDRQELITVTMVYDDWQRLTGMTLKRKKCKWIFWPPNGVRRCDNSKNTVAVLYGGGRAGFARSDNPEQEYYMGNPETRCIQCKKKAAVKTHGVPITDPCRLDPEILPKRCRWYCVPSGSSRSTLELGGCGKTWTTDIQWKKNPKFKPQERGKKQVKGAPEAIDWQGAKFGPETEPFKLLGINYDPMDITCHLKMTVKEVSERLDRIAQLPWAPAETVAKLEHSIMRKLTYGALAYSCERMKMTLELLQRRADAIVRARAGRAICVEVLYGSTRTGGVGVPNIQGELQQARITCAHRMWNAVDNIASDVIQWEAVRFSTNMRYVRHKPQPGETVLENEADMQDIRMGRYMKSELMHTVAMDMREYGLVFHIAEPNRSNEWEPHQMEYPPQIRNLAERLSNELNGKKDTTRVLMGSDGGVKTVWDETALITAGVAITVQKKSGAQKKMQAGFRFAGTPTSYFAEAVAMEAMLYLGWRTRETLKDIEELVYVSDSANNVDLVKDVVAGGKPTKNNSIPTRVQRMACLVNKSGGQLSWIRGHQDDKKDERVEVNVRADAEATKARTAAEWFPLSWRGSRPIKYQRPATLIAEELEAERHVGPCIRRIRDEFGTWKMREEHPGMPAVNATKRLENTAMMRVSFEGIWAHGWSKRTLLRQCRGGGWCDIRTKTNGKCLACGKEPPTLTHCLMACTLPDEKFTDSIAKRLRDGGIMDSNVDRIMALLRQRKRRRDVLLGILPDEYYEDVGIKGHDKKAKKQRWKQGAGAANILARHAMDILSEYYDRVRALADGTPEDKMGWYQSSRSTGYQ